MAPSGPIVTTSQPGELPDFSRVEAQCVILVDQSLRQRKVKTTARRLQRWFRRYSTIDEFINGSELGSVATPHQRISRSNLTFSRPKIKQASKMPAATERRLKKTCKTAGIVLQKRSRTFSNPRRNRYPWNAQ